MRLNVIALTITTGLLWGAAVLLTTVANAIWPPYGQAFLDLAASIYPGYNSGPTIGQIIIGTIYALVDGAVGGLLFGWIYNSTLKCCPGKTA